jgi:hypothetical protein
MKKFSVNTKLNGVLNEILSDLLEISETEEMSRNEVKRYVREFPREIDFNLAQYGNMLIYYWDVREFYKKHGYKSMDKWSDTKIWNVYCNQVGYMARLIAYNRA